MKNEIVDYPVVIHGGGMVGSALACALADMDLQVLLLEARLPSPPNEQVDLRVSALSLASQRILQNLRVWEEIARQRISPYEHMHVWDAGNHGQIHFSSAMVGEPYLGWIVENNLIQHALLKRLQQHPRVTLRYPASLKNLRARGQQMQLELDDGEQLSTHLLVGADGARSRVRELANITTAGWSYQQRALVTHVRTEHAHQKTAWQRFLATGTLAFLPLADGRCSIVWSTGESHAKTLLAMDDAALGEALTEAFQGRLGAVHVDGPRGAFPLCLQHTRRYVAPRIALVGDAAHVIHPLAGQGVNLGLLDAATLAEVLRQAHGQSADLGNLSVLRGFERWRKGHNLLMMASMDGLQKLFRQTIAPLRTLRGVGLMIADRMPPLKQQFIRQAMGLDGDLPPLARPCLDDDH